MTVLFNASATAKPASKSEHVATDILKIAVLAVGGQGGGVLANWIADLATLGGYASQMTSVAGVAQRTGATIYYIEMTPKTARAPVFALTPAPGDVDIVIAAELMEAGRAVLRGFVSESRTTLIASTHRILAVDEKQTPGDGRADSSLVLEKIRAAAHRSICFDMETPARETGSMISASLFGALASSGATPFTQALFEQVINDSGRGVSASLAAFTKSLNQDQLHPQEADPEQKNRAPGTSLPDATLNVRGPAHLMAQWQQQADQVMQLPVTVQTMAMAGLRKVVDYQDLNYGAEYLQHVNRFMPYDSSEQQYDLTRHAAKYIANAMCYDDIVRVADLKTRASRSARVAQEQHAQDDQIVQVTEYFHPRAEEICGSLPHKLGAWIERHPRWMKGIDIVVNRGRRIRTDRLWGFSLLWIASSLKPMRRRLLRHQYETTHLNHLIDISLNRAEQSPSVAIELLKCQRLIKGYSDTHSRGQSKFLKITRAVSQKESSPRTADWIRKLRDAALEDDKEDVLNRLLEAE